MPSYSYSFDREHWTGRFSSRREAEQAGVARGARKTVTPESVYVG